MLQKQEIEIRVDRNDKYGAWEDNNVITANRKEQNAERESDVREKRKDFVLHTLN